MISYLQSTNKIDAPTASVWKVIKKGDKVEAWHPLINSCYLKGNERICTTEPGKLQETILVIDEINKTFKYKIHDQKVYPIPSHITCTMKIIEGKDGTLLLWDIEFDLKGQENISEISENFIMLGEMVARNLEDLCS